MQLTGTAGGSGGDAYTITCPAGYVAVGMGGRAGSNIDRLEILCKDLTLSTRVAVTGSTIVPVIGSGYAVSGPAGGYGGSGFTLWCPAGYVMTGVQGTEGGWIDYLALQCKELGTGTSAVTSYVGSNFGGYSYSLSCPGSTMATGLQGKAGDKVDSIRVRCQ